MDSLAQGYWLSITRQCLRADDARDAVPVLLFWLDCLALTRAVATPAPLVGLGLANDLGSSYDARLQAWLSYAAEVYSYPRTEAAEEAWTSPLRLSAIDVASVLDAVKTKKSTTESLEVIRQAAEVAGDWLVQQQITGKDQVQEQLHTINKSAGSPSHDPETDLSFYHFITDSLSNSRTSWISEEAEKDRVSCLRANATLFRSILSSLVEHHFGEAARSVSSSASSRISAQSGQTSESDETAISLYYPRIIPQLSSTESFSPPESPARTASKNTAALKRDDKLRWLSGESAEARKAMFCRPSGTYSPPLLLDSSASSIRSRRSSHRPVLSDGDIIPTGSPRDEVGEILFSKPQSGARRRAWSTESGTTISQAQHVSISRESDSFSIHRGHNSSIKSADSFGSTSQLLATPPQPTQIRSLSADVANFDTPASPRPFDNLDADLPSPVSPKLYQFPLTSNTLSPEERKTLVKRSKKLQTLLGSTLDEAAARKTLTIGARATSDPPLPSPDSFSFEFPGRRGRRRSSFPPPSPTNFRDMPPSPTIDFKMQRSTSYDATFSPNSLATSQTSTSRGLTDDFGSPETSGSPQTPYHYSAAQPWGYAYASDQRIKEERRKRVQKIYALLGEQVPLANILDQPVRPTYGHQRQQSRFNQASGMLFKGLGKLGLKKTDVSSSDEAEVERPRIDLPQNMDEEPVTLSTLSRASKLENLLGELPPSHLRRSKSVLHHQKTSSLDSDIDSNEEANSPTSGLLAQRRSSVLSTRSSRSSLRQKSVANLAYLARTDPAALVENVTSLYDDEECYAGDLVRPQTSMTQISGIESCMESAYEPEEEHFEDARTSISSNRLSIEPLPRRSIDKTRQIRSAAKVSAFFGTTSVLERLLRDIEEDCEEDAEASPDEKREIMMQLSRLRKSALAAT